jgi:hypothetical protein
MKNPKGKDLKKIERLSRREALKALASLSGALGASLILPQKWIAPTIKAGFLPAHAQSTAPPLPGFLDVLASWSNLGGVVDIDLMVWDPGGTGEQVDWMNTNGPTATHSGDNIAFTPPRNWEEVSVPSGGTAVGTYRAWVHAHEEFAVPVSVQVTSHTDAQTFNVVAPANVVNTPVALIDFPSGAISAWSGPVAPQIPGKGKPENK